MSGYSKVLGGVVCEHLECHHCDVRGGEQRHIIS